MKKIGLYIIIVAFLVSCSQEQDTLHNDTLTPAQMELIGQRVNFSTSIAEPFVTRTTYRRDGSFNEDDIMYIYRQYIGSNGTTFDTTTEAYRVYSLTTKYITGTSFALETDWHPVKGATGYNPATSEYPENKQGYFPQEEDDSLTWDNGKTVRFRAWSRSNLAGAIGNSTAYERGRYSSDQSYRDAHASARNRYYPDYCVSEWVTVSGPTLDVPLTLKHQGCRIEFVCKAGNEFYKAEICTNWEDYKRLDNADNADFKEGDDVYDNSLSESGKTAEDAQAECQQVVDVYNRMCMPAGVDIEKALLTTVTSATFTNDTTNLGQIHAWQAKDDFSTGIVAFGKMTADVIASTVQRPLFCSNDGRLDMITIPYDMSSSSTQGESLTLPACTRIKIWLYDINNGDKANTSDQEGTYHIFSLGDIKKSDGSAMFPKGLELKGGYSYRFDVGYHYDHLTITPADNFSWEQQDEDNEAGTGLSQVVEQPTNTTPYQWWTNAIKNAIPKTNTESYKPEFHITNEAEFLEFINLVNGTAVSDYVTANPLTQLIDPTGNFTAENPATKADYRWYLSSQCENGRLKAWVNPKDSLKHSEALELGYIFYEHYHSANADQAAYSVEDYLSGPYSFYDESLSRHFVVHLDADLDLRDWKLTTIGNSTANRFRGVFDGYEEIMDDEGKVVTAVAVHSLKNVYFDGGYMFGYCYDAAIRNLHIETTHPFMLVNTAEAKESTGYGAYIVGISIKAPTTVNPIAAKLLGSSYVVGCIYEGHATGAMVGEADNLNMYANMMAATGLTATTGALLGQYTSGSSEFFKPQEGKNVAWGRFMANYYLMDRYTADSTNVVQAVGGIIDKYRPQEYIRGGLSWVLKAQNDNLLDKSVPYERLTTQLMRKGYYGLAPWKAMNYALYEYNLVGAQVDEAHNCKGHFVNNNEGYVHRYPYMVPGEPNSVWDATGYKDNYGSLNLLEQNN